MECNFAKYVEDFMVACNQTVKECNDDQTELYLNLIYEELKEFEIAKNAKNEILDVINYYNNELGFSEDKLKEISKNFNDIDTETPQLDACMDMIWVIIGFCLSKGWDVEGAFSEVARSNMSKVDPLTGKVIKRVDGKVMKPTTYSPPELSQFLKRD